MTWWMAKTIATSVELYLGAGVLFALAFLPRGVLTIDEGLRASPVAVRVLLAPGMTLLWPIFLRRWIAGTPAPVERTHIGAPRARAPGARRDCAPASPTPPPDADAVPAAGADRVVPPEAAGDRFARRLDPGIVERRPVALTASLRPPCICAICTSALSRPQP